LGVELGCRSKWSTATRSPGRGWACGFSARCAGICRSAAPGRSHFHRGIAPGRSIRPGQPGVCGVPAGQIGRRDGRRSPLRLCDRFARGRDHGFHDRPLGASALRFSGSGVAPHHQRSAMAFRGWSTTCRASRRRPSSGSEQQGGFVKQGGARMPIATGCAGRWIGATGCGGGRGAGGGGAGAGRRSVSAKVGTDRLAPAIRPLMPRWWRCGRRRRGPAITGW
jgi:hypothetical protein